ncbi:alpha/beta fold hydrolase [Bosea sp. 124]|uniref:alpha/beta fold hydrolase n=1 Tax=Bosea sp. 124 TaxID=2135642 RepID=UPI000D3BEE47|nr:alpha/beta fold hydrolase [Bosea sp. 124]PTM43441.1 3-oxoadipate enol-lactonase [Bosea sp. 124]
MTRDQIVDLNGLSFRCRIDEPANAASSTPWLVFSNSLMTDLTLWDDQVAAFGGRYRILRYDQRGHGQTSVPPASCDFETLADDLAGLFDALGIARAVLVGVSMGGITALSFAARHPSRLSALLACDCTAKGVPGAGNAWDERIALAKAGGMTALAGPTIERWFRPEHVESPAGKRVRRMVETTPFDGFVRASDALRDFDVTAGLTGLSCPAALLVGAGDGALPGVMKQMAEQVSGVAFIEIPDAGHLPNVENPDAFNRELAAFLKRVAA